MKTKILSGFAATVMLAAGCNSNSEGRFLNLTSGETVELTEDKDGRMVNKETGEPVALYVDRRTADTIYGPTGKVVNGSLAYDKADKVYVYDDGERKIKDGDSKEKGDLDGSEYKYKDGNVTIKRDGGDYKEEGNGYTKKVDADGDVKYENKDYKVKIDGETGEKKVKERSVFGKVKDKVTGQ